MNSVTASENQSNPDVWSIDRARETYNIARWSAGYFDVNEEGNLVVQADEKDSTRRMNILELVEGLSDRGLQTPLLLRFSDLLRRRLWDIQGCFERAFASLGYQGGYRAVYPMKVNHQQQVVDDLMHFGKDVHYGLEVGSKAELLAAVAYLKDPEALLVCHGHKDESFIDMALHATRMGIQAMLVIEMPVELELVLKRSRALGIEPHIGVRVRLSTEVDSHWSHSSGDHSVFGLDIPELVDVIDRLKAEDRLSCLKMFHFHAGSQISNILHVREAASEAVRIYSRLVQEGAPLTYFDLGGGLAVDYDGTHSSGANSSNYSLEEYATDVVELLLSEAKRTGIPHPTIVTECGRATVAHHSMLVFDILEVRKAGSTSRPQRPQDGLPEVMENLEEVERNLETAGLQESYHDAVFYRDELRSQFGYGLISLRDRAYGERLFSYILSVIARRAQDLDVVPDDLEGVQAYQTDIYHANISIFQSLPDVWAIDQLFPIIPIHRLNEEPTRQGVLSDITCDCDGRIDRFVDASQIQSALPLHDPGSSPYYLGVFLVGAYQETLGDLHNLLGDTHVVSVSLGEDGNIELNREVTGDSVEEVLSYVEYSPSVLMEQIRNTAEMAVRSGRITPIQRRDFLASCRKMMQGYTYCER